MYSHLTSACLARDPTTRYPFSRFMEGHDQEVVMGYTHRYDAARQVNHVTAYTRDPSSQEERIDHLTTRMYFPQELTPLE